MEYVRKVCGKCGVNFVDSCDELCELCKGSIPSGSGQNRNGKSYNNYAYVPREILENGELCGIRFDINIYGFGEYLRARRYRPLTVAAYVRSVEIIAETENKIFVQMTYDIDRLASDYGIRGIKSHLGDYGHGTWRNALNRLRDFVEYISVFMKK